MIVCVCRRVSDRDIHRAAREGVESFDALQKECGVGTACGSCIDSAVDIWAGACQGAGVRTGAASPGCANRAVPA
jgi:bacterioferritin-associated ferredoxin